MQKLFLCLIVTVVFCIPGTLFAQKSHAGKQHDYVGTKTCRKCHFKQFKSWKTTKMADAFELLKPGVKSQEKKKAGLDPDKDYTTDATCLPCHTTGYGEPGGFVSEKKTPELVGVSCEMCHGAGGTYTEEQYMSNKNKSYKRSTVESVGLVSKPTKEVCVTCHNKKSPFYKPFDFNKRKTEGTHQHEDLKYDHE